VLRCTVIASGPAFINVPRSGPPVVRSTRTRLPGGIFWA
jgi:hypothetical protein